MSEERERDIEDVFLLGYNLGADHGETDTADPGYARQWFRDNGAKALGHLLRTPSPPVLHVPLWIASGSPATPSEDSPGEGWAAGSFTPSGFGPVCTECGKWTYRIDTRTWKTTCNHCGAPWPHEEAEPTDSAVPAPETSEADDGE